MKPIVTIGIPVYKVADYIERCACSLFSQTYENIEYVFVDDHTPDDSIVILQRVLEKYPKRKNQVRIVLHDNNKGIAEVRNTIIQNCGGEFLLFVDSDDWIDEETVENVIAAQNEGDYDIVAFDTLAHYPNKIKEMLLPNYNSPEEMLKMILFRGSHAVWGKLFRTALFKENDISCAPGINYGEDIQILAKVTFCANKVINLRKCHYHYNCQNANSYVSNPSEKAYIQTIQSYNIVKTFFVAKGENYNFYANLAELQGLLYEVRLNDDDRFQYAIRRIRLLGNDMKKYVPCNKRIVYVTMNKFIIQTYFKIALYLKAHNRRL